MPSFTTPADGRDTRDLKLTEGEAWEMLNAGFKFAEFNRPLEIYRLTAPYKLLHNLHRGLVTLQQK